MRSYGLALALIAAVLGACGGGDQGNADTAAAATDTASVATEAPDAPVGGAAPAGAATGAATVALAPVVGTTHEVRMVGDAKGYRFEPANITIESGDAIKFTVVSGGPHNVAFDPARVRADAKAQLDANMGANKTGELSSAMKMNPGESITISFTDIGTGKYPFTCTPHLAMNMKGVVTVK